MALIFGLSSLTGTTVNSVVEVSVPILAILVGTHVVEFGVLALLIHRVVRLNRSWPASFRWIVVAVGAIGYGLTDEFHQSFVPGRVSSWMDIGFDAVGALAGIALSEVLIQWRAWIDGGKRLRHSEQ